MNIIITHTYYNMHIIIVYSGYFYWAYNFWYKIPDTSIEPIIFDIKYPKNLVDLKLSRY